MSLVAATCTFLFLPSAIDPSACQVSSCHRFFFLHVPGPRACTVRSFHRSVVRVHHRPPTVRDKGRAAVPACVPVHFRIAPARFQHVRFAVLAIVATFATDRCSFRLAFEHEDRWDPRPTDPTRDHTSTNHPPNGPAPSASLSLKPSQLLPPCLRLGYLHRPRGGKRRERQARRSMACIQAKSGRMPGDAQREETSR